MKSVYYFFGAVLTLPLFLFSLSAWGDSYEENFRKAYLASHFARTIKNSIQANEVLYRNVYNKFNFNLISELNRNKGERLSSNQLQKIGRYEEVLDTLTIGGRYRLVNSPILSSLTFDTSYTYQKSDYQLLDDAYKTPSDNAQALALTVSYDVVKGGRNDPQFLASTVEMFSLKANLYNTFKTQRDNYLTFLASAYAVMVGQCRLKNVETSVKELEKTEKVFQIGSQVGTYPYKDYLNVRSLKKVLESTLLTIKIDLLNRRQNFKVFGPASGKVLDEIMQDPNYCDSYLGLAATNKNKIQSVTSSLQEFGKTLDSLSVHSQIDSAKNLIKSAQVNLRPSVEPFVTYSRSEEQTLDIEDRRITLGVKFDWDVASKYGKATSSSELFNLAQLGAQYKIAERQFENDITNLGNRNEVIGYQIENIHAIIDINDELLRILNTQRSIGKVDSLSLTNAYLNRNQSLNQLYDLNAEMILNNYRYSYTFEWDSFAIPVDGSLN